MFFYIYVSVLILDEIDCLITRDQEVLYKIFEWPKLKGSKLVLIGIANAIDMTDRFLPRLKAKNCESQSLFFFFFLLVSVFETVSDLGGFFSPYFAWLMLIFPSLPDTFSF